jgi:hypothetical protein
VETNQLVSLVHTMPFLEINNEGSRKVRNRLTVGWCMDVRCHTWKVSI